MSLFNLQLFTLYSEKLNAKNYDTAVDISSDSFKQFRAKTKDDFSYLEAKKIHNEAEKYTKKLGNQQLKVLRRAAPQLQTAMSAVQASRVLTTPDYENLFGRRAEQYAPADSIASRFSPTAYLTELYREAKELQGEGMPEHIDVRRPDIGSLILNQAAQDETLSTLSMANEVIKASIGEANIEETLSILPEDSELIGDPDTEKTLPKGLPFHLPFERIQSAMATKGIEFSHIATFFEYDRRPASHLKFNSLLCLELDICPSLYDKLKETNENQLNLWLQATELSSFYMEQILDFWGDSLTSNLSYALYDVSFIKKLAAQGWAYEDALVLLGYEISNQKNGSKASQFDRLFNTNPLEGRTFTVDNSSGSMNYKPESNEFIYERNVLKKAFEVDDQELFDISKWIDPSDTRSLHSISAAYQLTLLAKLLESSVSELTDFICGPVDYLGVFPFQILGDKSDHYFYIFFGMIIDRFNWLVETNLDYSTVSLMLGESTPKSESPQMIQLWKDIDLQANGHSTSGIEEVIASSFLLTNSTISSLVLDWAESTSNYTTKQYIDNINRYLNSQESELKKIIDFTGRIAQLSIIVNHFQLTSAELELFKQERLEWQTLMDISYIKQGILVLNTSNASTYLSLQPQENKLSVENMIDLLCEDYSEENIQSAYANISGLSGGEHFYRCIKLLEFSKSKKLPVEMFVALASKESSSYTHEDWSAIAHKCEAALSHNQFSKHKNKVDESLSQALCGYFLANKSEAVTSFDLNDREDLYRYLLIDNKVSGEILTTRVAEAIASLQLYVNKCIQGFESNIDHELLLRPFFEHWSRYNNRYSTWAGLEKLTFYPENYVEPTLRYNQTRLQQGLLSDISQNQLSDDTVDDAYHRYLSQFEEVANLDILSGYLHGNDFNLGDSYFVARSKEKPHRYYWRSLDNTASDGMGGYVASAWSEWVEITTPMTPLRDQVRVVMFQDRLYISWIEAMEPAEADSSGDTVKPTTSYQLKLSYRKIDGTWAAALDYPLNIPSSLIGTFNLHSTYHSETESMLFMLYNPNKVPAYYDGIGTQGHGEGPAYGGFIGADLQFKEKAANVEDWKYIYTNFENNLNTSNVKNKVIRYVPDAYYEYETPLKLLSPNTNKDGIVSNVSIDEQYIDNDDIPPNFCCKTSFDVKVACDSICTTIGGDTPSEVEITGIFNVKIYSDRFEFDIHQGNDNTRLNCRPEGGDSRVSSHWPWSNGKKKFRVYYVFPQNATSRRFEVTVYQDKPGHGRYKQVLDLKIQSSIGVNHWGSNWKALPLYPSTQKLNHTFFYELNGGELKRTPVLKVNKSGGLVYQQSLQIDVGSSANVNPVDNMLIVNGSNGACYLEFTNKARRIRLNTLFAKELISRARYGLDNVLSWETQQLAEPKLGKGSYIDVTFPAYDPKQHGSGQFTVHTVGVNYKRSQAPALSGQLTEGVPTIVEVFLPHSDHYDDSQGTGEKGWVYLGVTFSDGNSILGSSHDYQKMDCYVWNQNEGRYIQDKWRVAGASTQISELQTEPMDFSGANSLYFWELFYYTPMMVADRLLQSQAFESAERWLKYVFSPSGYNEKSIEGLEHTGRQWNMRPLQEDTAWDDDNIDTTDPDIVAQADPMHYKVATYMKLLDLLIARGDMAYRRLERDTLNEAKMWYSVAKNLLGDTSESTSVGDWSELPLNVVADKEVQKAALKAMDQIMAGQASQASYDDRVKALFYPTGNDKLTGYDKTLNQRLFNLRHNLSIDGQPLTLPIYAEPADPKVLHRTAAASVNGGYGDMGQASIAIQRFPIMLESARGLVNQLTHYGSSLLSVLEKKDAEGLSLLMQTHAVEVMGSTIDQQSLMVDELKSEQSLLVVNLDRAKASLDTYQTWLKEGVSRAEKDAINTRITAGATTTQANLFRMAGAAIDTAPNVFGLAFGGMQLGALAHAAGAGLDAVASAMVTGAEASEASEQYRRRAQEWESARDDAKLAVEEIKQQQKTLVIRLEAAEMQKSLLETQKLQFNEQLDLMKTKFTNQSLYSWMQGKLSTLYYQFYDLVAMRCLKAQLGYQWETQDTSTFIQPGAWDSHRAGLLCGEALMLNLTQMESTYLDWDSRSLEVNRTVSMLSEMGEGVDFNTEVNRALNAQDPSVSSQHTMVMGDNNVLMATIDLNALNIEADYPDAVVGDNKVRRIKQVSVSLPALLGPYQDIQAVLSYSGNGDLIHQSCKQAAISHGMNDSGQFQLDFNDSRYLPFEGLPIDGNGSASLMLTFPNAGDKGKQRALLESLTDIILHIRYTIGSSK